MLISIIVPAYNEAQRLPPSLDKILAFLAQQPWRSELIVVNDGSSDATAEVVTRYAAANPTVRLINNPGNRGKGYSVRNGVLASQGDFILFSDADLSSPIEECLRLIAELEKGADIAIGSRWLDRDTQTEPQPILRQIAGRAYNLLLRAVLGLNFKDTQCGMKAFTRRAAALVFPRQSIERWGFDPELLYIARLQKLQVVEVSVLWAHDDRSKINPLVDGVKMGREMLEIKRNGLAGRYRLPQPGLEISAQK